MLLPNKPILFEPYAVPRMAVAPPPVVEVAKPWIAATVSESDWAAVSTANAEGASPGGATKLLFKMWTGKPGVVVPIPIFPPFWKMLEFPIRWDPVNKGI